MVLQLPHLGSVVYSEQGGLGLGAHRAHISDVHHFDCHFSELPLVPEVVRVDEFLHQVNIGLDSLLDRIALSFIFLLGNHLQEVGQFVYFLGKEEEEYGGVGLH